MDVKYGGASEIAGVPTLLRNVIQAYLNAVGAIAPPTYDFWAGKLAHSQFAAWSMISLVWTSWLVNQFLLLIILTNFINATFGGINEVALGRRDMKRIQIRAQMNLDCWIFLSALGRDEPFDAIVVKYLVNPPRDPRWHGYTRTVTNIIEDQTALLVKEIKRFTSANEQVQQLEKQVKQITGNISSILTRL